MPCKQQTFTGSARVNKASGHTSTHLVINRWTSNTPELRHQVSAIDATVSTNRTHLKAFVPRPLNLLKPTQWRSYSFCCPESTPTSCPSPPQHKTNCCPPQQENFKKVLPTLNEGKKRVAQGDPPLGTPPPFVAPLTPSLDLLRNIVRGHAVICVARATFHLCAVNLLLRRSVFLSHF